MSNILMVFTLSLQETQIFSHILFLYLHIFPEFLQEHFLVLLVNVDLLPVIDEVIVLVGGKLLGLLISSGD